MTLIIDYGMGNLGSISNMITRTGYRSEITSDLSSIENADRIILPGVGAFDNAINNIRRLNLFDLIRKKVLVDRVPILGICLGMQLMAFTSEEGKHQGLGLINANVKRFSLNRDNKLKIPHMGWNTVRIQKENPLLSQLSDESRFYFVHSFHAICSDLDDILTFTHYGYDFVSSFSRDNIYGVQFHPEKSHKFGMQLIKNFIEIC